MTRSLVLVLCLLLTAVRAFADEPRRPPRFEIGGQIGVLAALSGDGLFPLAAAGPRLSINLTERLGLDVTGEVVGPTESDAQQGLYQIQARWVVRPGGGDRNTIFLTAGTAGAFRNWDVPEFRYAMPDGTIVVIPARTGIEVEPPFAIAGGIGAQRPFARYAAFRVDAQGMVGVHGGWVIRGALGISVPIGRYR